MATHDVQITGLTPGYKDMRLTIDGTDISPRALAGLSVRADAYEVPQITLDLSVLDITMLSGEVEILIPRKTRELLVELGWTPPADE